MKLFKIIIFIPFFCFSQETKLNFFTAADSIIFKKFNISISVDFQIPALSNYEKHYSCNCTPNGDGSIFVTKYPYRVISANRRTFQYNLVFDYKLTKRFYVQSGLNFFPLYTSGKIKGDSIITSKGVVNQIDGENYLRNYSVPLNLEFRLNKYFFPFFGISSSVYEYRNYNYLTPELIDKSFVEKGMQFHFAQSKVIGVNFMIPKTNRVYVNLKTIYRNKDWRFDRNFMWYSFGLKFYIL